MESGVPSARSGQAEPRAARPADVTWQRLQDQTAWFDLARAGHYADATDVDILLADSVERILGQETTHWAERETA